MSDYLSAALIPFLIVPNMSARDLRTTTPHTITNLSCPDQWRIMTSFWQRFPPSHPTLLISLMWRRMTACLSSNILCTAMRNKCLKRDVDGLAKILWDRSWDKLKMVSCWNFPAGKVLTDEPSAPSRSVERFGFLSVQINTELVRHLLYLPYVRAVWVLGASPNTKWTNDLGSSPSHQFASLFYSGLSSL